MEEQVKLLNDRLTTIENNLGGLSNDPRQIEVIKKAVGDTLPQLRVEKFGVALAPVNRQAHIDDPSGGGTVDTESRSAINDILDTLEAFGFNATS